MNNNDTSTSVEKPKKSKLTAFSLDFEYNRTLHEERQKLKQRTSH